MTETFQSFIARDRERLNSEREAIFTQQQALEDQLAEINKELVAIEAYEAAKTGKAGTPRAARRSGGRRGSKREGIIAVLKQHSEGLTRGELLEALGLKGDKSGEMSVSNALTALTKSNQVRRDGGKYLAA